MMQKPYYEYKTLVYRPDDHPDDGDLAGYLNSLGYAGWRLVGIIQPSADFFGEFIFERQVGPDKDKQS